MATTNPTQIELSKRILSVAPSVTLAITAKAKEMKAQGIDVLSLSAGEPDFDTPDAFKEAAIDAIRKGQTKYTPASGTVEFRKAIAEKLKRDQGLTFSPEQIVVCVGAKHAIFNILFALINEEDEILIPSPFWLSYPEMVTVLGGKSRFVETSEETEFKLTPEVLRKKMDDKVKVIILNSPCNPTGAVYSKDELEGLIEVMKDFPRAVIISDEIYEKLIFDGRKHYSVASLDSEIAKRTVIVNGHSKAYSMTGWRLGYAAFPTAGFAKTVAGLQSHSTSNPTSFAQAGGIKAINEGDPAAAKMCSAFEKRRDMFVELLSAIPKLQLFKPQGAFYIFVNISKTGLDSMKFSERLLQEAHVAVVPGKPFGSDDHVRMSFAASEQTLKEAARRLSGWIKKL